MKMNKWDLYNKNFEKTNETINENDEILEGKYHWTINTFIINSKKQVLLIKRSLNYNLHYPGFWNTINGNTLSGQNADETVISSIYNKIGIKVQKDEIKSIDKQLRDPYKYIYETFIVNKDINLEEIIFIDGTCVQAKWVDLEELYNMISNGEIAWVMISRIEKYVIPRLK